MYVYVYIPCLSLYSGNVQWNQELLLTQWYSLIYMELWLSVLCMCVKYQLMNKTGL